MVVDGGGSRRCALIGDIIGDDLVKNGWAGIVVHGCVRDSALLGQIDIGVKALGTIPRAPVKKGVGAVGGELSFGGVTWRTDDVVFADEDGIVVLTPSEAPSA